MNMQGPTGYASNAQGASDSRRQLMADSRSSVVPFLKSSINLCIKIMETSFKDHQLFF